MKNSFIKIIIITFVIGHGFGWAQWTYPGCDPLTDNDFTQETVISLQNDPSLLEPLKMAFDMDDNGNVDIYFIQRLGEVKYYKGSDQSITEIGNINPETGNEDGLAGIALDPNFKDNHRMFLFYSHSTGFRVSRFTLNPTTKMINMNSEAVLLTIPSGRDRWHTSGAMQFDAYGDLWISVGDNEATKKGPANTSDLRGGILRIHPEEDGSYTIPEGNLWEFGAEYFDDENMGSVADAYRDSSKMKREIYAMGTRNAYTLTLDPVRRWAVYGDCGPDQESGSTTDQSLWTEEHNVVTEPSFMGWPFWTSFQKDQTVFPGGYDEPNESNYWTDISSLNPMAPVNNHPDAGISNLLPAKPGTHSYAHSCAMTGPIYRYDGDLNNNSKLPPHLNRVWFVADFNKGNWFRAIELDDEGQMVGQAQPIFNGFEIHLPLDFQQGPDGALYVLSYSCGGWRQANACTEISRISYTGSCQDPSLKLETPIVSVTGRDVVEFAQRLGNEIHIGQNAGYQLKIRNMRGQVVHSFSSEGPGRLSLSEILKSQSGVYILSIESRKGVFSEKVPYFPN